METTPARRGGLLRNMFHLGVGQVATTALAMLLSAAIARTLGAADFGLLYLLTSFASFAYVFVDWGHGPYVTREVAIHPHRSGEMVGSVLVVRALTALLTCAAAMAIAWILGYDLRTRVLAAALILAWLPQYLGLSFGWVFRGSERMEYDALLQVVLKVSTLALALAALAAGGRLVALIPAYAAAGVTTLATAFVVYRRLGFARLRVSRSAMQELVWKGAPLMAISLAVAIQMYVDANILYAFASKEAMGWYGATWAIASTLVAPATILGSAMYPQLARAAGRRDEFAHALRTTFRPLLLVAVLGGVGTYLFADFAVSAIYGYDKFGPAAHILRAFAPALMLIYIDMVFGYAIVAAGKAGPLAKAKVIAVLVGIAVELALVPWFQTRFGNGGIGIVVGLAAGELVMVTSAVLLIRDVVERGMFFDALRALTAAAATIVLMKMVAALTPLLGIPLCVATFAVMSMAVGLVTRADVELVVAKFARRNRLVPEMGVGPQ
jgi:PST family polysaccharide transporter